MRNPLDRLTSRLPPPVATAVDWVATIAIAVLAVLFVKVEVANPYRIPSPSMEPTLHCAKPTEGCLGSFSDRVVANRFIYRFRDPERGEIAVFETAATESACGQEGAFVKRIVGLPGEVVSVRDGFVYIDGERLPEPYVEPGFRDDQTKTWRPVGEDSYFVLGDNRAASCDSRIWGPVPREDLIGPIFLTYWPPNRLGAS